MSAVYICTKDRRDNLRKVVPRWMYTLPNTPIIVMVDDSAVEDHDDLARREGWAGQVKILSTGKNNAGIGYARMKVVQHAANSDMKSIIMADDDIMPARNSYPNMLLRAARQPWVLGVGAVRSYHDFLSKGVTSLDDTLMLCPSGWGFQLYGLNVKNALAAGNFDSALNCFGEDAEMMRGGIANGIPWLLHRGVRAEPLGKRGAPGGISSLLPAERKKQEAICQQIIHDRWPEYTSKPPKPSRMAWQKFYDHYIPDWKAQSAIHGGQL